MSPTNLLLAILATSAFASPGTVQASTAGSLWENTGAWGENWSATDTGPGANVTPIGSPNVTFTLPNGGLDFDSRNAANGYTIGGWLATGGATIVTGAGEAGNTMDNIIVTISGMVSVTSGETFTVQQDDGLVLTIAGNTVLNNPGPNSPTQYTGTYNGPSGNQPFTLEYSEIDGPPAVLAIDLPFTQIPEPRNMAAGALLLLFGASALRKLRKRQLR
jgi:hypothetical protein